MDIFENKDFDFVFGERGFDLRRGLGLGGWENPR